ncbi:MAG: hypothetical protein ACTSRT_21505, partial [Promethearchaeota archaeon]
NIKLAKRERYNFKITRNRLNIDWIKREYFSDLLVSIVDTVHALMNNTTEEVAKSGLSRIILQGFEESEIFRLDKAFTAREKLNLNIVFARMIHAQISAAFPPPKQSLKSPQHSPLQNNPILIKNCPPPYKETSLTPS